MSPLGHQVVVELTGSEAADSPRLPGLVAGLKTGAVLADRGYDAAANRAAIRARGAEPCIPPRRSSTTGTCTRRGTRPSGTSPGSKQYRRVATQYDEKAVDFMGFLWLASIAIMLD